MDPIQLRLAALDFAIRAQEGDVIKLAQQILDFINNSTTITEVLV
jgi:hypothetical protein